MRFPDLRNPRKLAAALLGAWLVGLALAVVFTEPPRPAPAESRAEAEPQPPALPEAGAGGSHASAILARAPWGGRLAEAADRASQSSAAGDAAGQNESPEALARRIARWRYLGSVRKGSELNAVFLDESDALVHLASGERLGGQLELSVLDDDHVVFDSVDNSRSVRLQLFGDTALELESDELPEAETEPPAGDTNDD